MEISIAELKIDEGLKSYEVVGSPEWLTELSRVNIFVGPNNSGKSRFLRSIAANLNKKANIRPKQLDTKKIASEIKKLKNSIENLIKEFSVLREFESSSEITETRTILTSIPDQDFFITNDNPFVNVLHESIGRLKNLVLRNNTQYSHNGRLYRLHDFVEKVKILATDFEKSIPDKELPTPSYKTIYIPTLRGIRTLLTPDDVYLTRTKNDYFPSEAGKEDKAPSEIFTGYSLYREFKKLLLGDLNQRKLAKSFEEFLSENFFEGEKIALIPRDIANKDDLYIKIGNEEEFPIQNLGDGIQQIIILTFPMYRDKEQDLAVFIEEPELYLHPGMQRVLLDTFLDERYFGNHQFFLTTHSNHFLDLTLDQDNISIYSFRKEYDDSGVSKFVIENLDGSKTNVLKSLGVKNSSVFLTNCTIWVEGITDRYYIRYYLDLYQKFLKLKTYEMVKEDVHYSFVEYGGSNISHWSFLDYEPKPINVERLCGRLLLITDKDGEGALERKTKLQRYLDGRYLCLKCREIENLLTKSILIEILKIYEKTDTLNHKRFSEADYREKYLGKFIEEKILKRKARRGSYQLPSGTLNDKFDFCKKAIASIKEFGELSSEAKKLTKKIYKFIKHNNS